MKRWFNVYTMHLMQLLHLHTGYKYFILSAAAAAAALSTICDDVHMIGIVHHLTLRGYFYHLQFHGRQEPYPAHLPYYVFFPFLPLSISPCTFQNTNEWRPNIGLVASPLADNQQIQNRWGLVDCLQFYFIFLNGCLCFFSLTHFPLLCYIVYDAGHSPRAVSRHIQRGPIPKQVHWASLLRRQIKKELSWVLSW